MVGLLAPLFFDFDQPMCEPVVSPRTPTDMSNLPAAAAATATSSSAAASLDAYHLLPRVNVQQPGIAWDTHVALVHPNNEGEGYLLPAGTVGRCSTMLNDFIRDGERDPGTPFCVPVGPNGITEKSVQICATYLGHYGGTTEATPGVASVPKPFTPGQPPNLDSLDRFERWLYESELKVPSKEQDLTELLAVINAANYLGAVGLIDLATMALALRIRGGTFDSIKTLFSTQRHFGGGKN